jgi:hypothetical protein
MMQHELGDIVASGRATPEQWNEYWSVYAENVERQRREKEQEVAKRASRVVQFEETFSPEICYPREPQEAEGEEEETAARSRGNRLSTVGGAGIGLGSALAVVLSFQSNHSIPWAILHGMLSWFYVIYRAWQGNY